MPVSAQVEYYDVSAHADRGGLRGFLEEYRGADLRVVHGDDPAGFAGELHADGHEASALEPGDVVTV